MENVKKALLVVFIMLLGLTSGMIWLGATGSSDKLLVLISLFLAPVLLLGLLYLGTGPVWPALSGIGFMLALAFELSGVLTTNAFSQDWAQIGIWIYPITWGIFWMLFDAHFTRVEITHHTTCIRHNEGPPEEDKPKE